MICQHCKSNRILIASGKSSDCNSFSFQGQSFEGYVPYDLNIGGGDYLEFKLCLQCGQLQGEFPIRELALENALENSTL